MKNSRIKLQVAVIFFLVLFLNACFNIRVIENVRDPDRYFKRANSQIEKIHRQDPEREGKPHVVHILIYEGSERKIIKVATPVWMANGCIDLGMKAAERDGDVDFDERYDFDWSGLRDLSQIGPGLLVEVDDEEDKILIWLE